jgi:hypothetical protein
MRTVVVRKEQLEENRQLFPRIRHEHGGFDKNTKSKRISLLHNDIIEESKTRRVLTDTSRDKYIENNTWAPVADMMKFIFECSSSISHE